MRSGCKSVQTVGGVLHVMSAGQNHQSFRILARVHLSIVQAFNITLAQIIHDLTFVLFAAIHFTKSPFLHQS